MKVRIQKLLAAVGIDSRRHIEEMVLEGRVAVNGKKARSLPVMVNEAADTVEIDGVEVYSPRKAKRRDAGAARGESHVYIVMNKPEKVYCTNVSQGEQLRAIDLLPPDFQTRVYPVGRLDAESRGLLLLTNDGDLTNKLTHPRYGVTKVYRAVVDGSFSGDLINELLKGVWLADSEGGAGFKAKAARVEIVKRMRERSVIDITLDEGRNRQIRRMLARLGHKVRTLTRIKFGPLDLNKLDLKPGQSRLLTPREVTMLKRAADKAGKPSTLGEAKPAKKWESKVKTTPPDRNRRG
jgi:23S rRNA pseudouridine2605 synthase